MAAHLNKLYDSIYYRLVAAFLLVITPFFAISLEMNESSENSVRSEIASSMQAKTQFYLKLLESDFSRTIALFQQYTNDDELNKISAIAGTMSTVEKTEAINRLQQKLRLLKDSSAYLTDSSVYIPELNRKISSDDYQAINPQEYDRMRRLPNHDEKPLAADGSRLFISQAMPNFLINIEVSVPKLNRALQQFTAGGNGGAAIVSRDGDWSIADGQGQEASLITAFQREFKGEAMPSSAGPRTFKADGKHYMISFERSAALGISLLVYMPEQDVLGPLERYRTWYWGMSILAALIIVVFSYSIYRIIHAPLRTLVSALRKVEKGDLTIQVKHRSRSEFRYVYDHFNAMTARLSQLIHEVYEQKFRANLSELRQLQSQINPHFLYNSFYNLYRLSKMHEVEKVIHLSKHLGGYYRFITNSGDEVPLQQEIDFAKSYAEIQMIRFEDHIQVRFGELPEPYRQLIVPKLILQPIIENSYVHALEARKEPGWIRVDFRKEAERLIIVVEDNGGAIDDAIVERLRLRLQSVEVMSGTGMLNVHRRLQLKFGPGAGIRLARGRHDGLQVSLILSE